jgi:hypothetical protein
MNTELLLKVKAHILEEPRRIWMSVWKKDADQKLSSEYEKGWLVPPTILTENERPPCNTVGCIAGWATTLAGKDFGSEYQAAKLLELDIDQKTKLFYVPNWPSDFQYAYRHAQDAKERADAVARRIDHFIATDGME